MFDRVGWSPKLHVEVVQWLAIAVDVETGKLVGVAVHVRDGVRHTGKDNMVQLVGGRDYVKDANAKKSRMRKAQRVARREPAL